MHLTICSECDHVTSDTRKKSPPQWTCIKHKRMPGGSFVDPDTWVEHEPYLRCVNLNAGACPLWTARRDGQKEMKLEDVA